ncbi:uncharacterized protein LOC112515603 [Cynara cardunculus var. scolymus]|uniref:uncharacterized protein LOC112515603 n=1 Tax=Cynara cardunculus var. scolymus TaxID=59895 RepID=UPI000D6263E9|nr:uncharacterized protein LOC112515603 [Cynara cardunculus var. scolymus]
MEFFDFCSQVVHGHFLDMDSNQKFHCSVVYDANDVTERRDLWNSIRRHNKFLKNDPWVVLGDFNVGLNPDDSFRGSSVISRGMSDFRDCVNEAELEDINQSGIKFTWIQKPMLEIGQRGLLKKLDRVFGNLSFMATFPSAHATFLPYGVSDHSPAIISFDDHLSLKPRPFKFNNHLADIPDFVPLIEKVWSNDVKRCCMYSVISKLKNVKKGLRKLNNDHGNVFGNVKKLRMELGRAQNDLDADPENERLLRQRAKIQWLKEGDANTTYFHNVVKSRTNKDRIDEIEDFGGNRYMRAVVAEQFVIHFEKMLGARVNVEVICDPTSLFFKKLSKDQADFMVRPIDDKEIK